MARGVLRRAAGAALLVLVTGCGGASGGAGAGHASATAAGWASWRVSLTARDVSGTCLPTARLLVCSVAPAGVVARSPATGEAAWRAAADETGGGRNAGLALDGGRAVTAGGRTIRAVDLASGKPAWSATLPSGSAFGAPAAADGTVYTVSHSPSSSGGASGTLTAYRASDGKRLWRADSEDDTPVAAGGRVYTVESGSRAVARDGRTGQVVARSDTSHPCPSLISGAGYLVCAEGGSAAGDVFPPVTLVDPATLATVRTLWQPGDKPNGGVITSDGVLVLRAVNAEDPSVGEWIAVDVRTGGKLWESDSTISDSGDQAVLAGDRVVWISEGRLVGVDPRKGPHATGAAAPRRSPVYPEADRDRYTDLMAQGSHIVLEPRLGPALRSVPAP